MHDDVNDGASGSGTGGSGTEVEVEWTLSGLCCLWFESGGETRGVIIGGTVRFKFPLRAFIEDLDIN